MANSLSFGRKRLLRARRIWNCWRRMQNYRDLPHWIALPRLNRDVWIANGAGRRNWRKA